MKAYQRMTGARLGLTYGAFLAVIGLTIAAVTAQPESPPEAPGTSLSR